MSLILISNVFGMHNENEIIPALNPFVIFIMQDDVVGLQEQIEKNVLSYKSCMPGNITMIHKASEYGAYNVLIWLLDNNSAMKNSKCNQDWTPLHSAAYGFVTHIPSNNRMSSKKRQTTSPVCVERLIQSEVELFGKTKKGWTVLHCAVAASSFENVYHILNGVDIYAKKNKIETICPLLHPEEKEIITTLLMMRKRPEGVIKLLPKPILLLITHQLHSLLLLKTFIFMTNNNNVSAYGFAKNMKLEDIVNLFDEVVDGKKTHFLPDDL